MKKIEQTNKLTALGILYRVLSTCSPWCLFFLAKGLAIVSSQTKSQILTVTQKNIQLCFPELSSKQKKKLVKASVHHTSCALLELAYIWNRPVDTVLKIITNKQICSRFTNSKKAKVLIAPHHGSWELLNLWLANQDTLYSLYKPAKSNSINQYILTKRSRNNAILVPANTSGLRKLLQGLKSKAICMILPDQRPATNTAQVNAPFYNHQAPTSLLIKRLLNKVDCDIFIASVIRDLAKGEYRLVIKSLDRSSFLQDDVESATYLNKSIEDFIKEDITQYQWAYRRYSKATYSKLTKAG